MNVFDRLESDVRSYCRAFPTVFQSARGASLFNERGEEYIDFFAGAGTLNYGHNNPVIKQAVLDYLQNDGVVHALDMWTVAKRNFLEKFDEIVLQPRRLDYKLQFTGPTGANAVEAALKLARKVKKRGNIVAFTNGYHGLSGGALAATGNRHFRNEAFVTRLNVSFAPFEGYFGPGVDTLACLRKALSDDSSGTDIPAAVILETIQAEGGINVASPEWLRGLERICREFDILLIIDDIQVGNGRSGRYFSFEEAGIKPDMVVLSKALGGLGLPMSLVLVDPKIDLWKPAEHTGTFRGNNLAFVAATRALDFWADDSFESSIAHKASIIQDCLLRIAASHADLGFKVRGRGLIWGLEVHRPDFAKAISKMCFERRLIIELAGPKDEVVKFLPPLVIDDSLLADGLRIVQETVRDLASKFA